MALTHGEREQYVLSDAKRNVMLGWAAVESGLHPSVDERDSRWYFQAAQTHAAAVVEGSVKAFSHHASATWLQLYLPAFRSRRNTEFPNANNVSSIVAGTHNLYEEILAAPVHTAKTHGEHYIQPDHQACFGHESDRDGMIAKLGIFMLANRAGILLYPASYREANMLGEENNRYHHDAYALDGDQKLPIKVRLESKKTVRSSADNYGQSLLYIPLRSMLAGAKHDAGMRVAGGERERLPSDVTSWLHDEYHGEKMSRARTLMLDLATDSLLERMTGFQAQLHPADVALPSLVNIRPDVRNKN